MKKHFRSYPIGSPEYVISHAAWRRSRGKQPSMIFQGEANPRKALDLAIWEYEMFQAIENPPATITRRVIGEIQTGGEPIEIFTTDVKNPSEILKLRPKTFKGTDGDWLMFASMFGIAHAMGHDFMDWQSAKYEAGELFDTGPNFSDRISSLFGEPGKLAAEGMTDTSQWPKMTETIVIQLKQGWSHEKLGLFGKWLQEAGISKDFVAEVAKEYLED